MVDASREPGIRFSGVVVDRIRFDDLEVGSKPPEDLEYQISIQRQSFKDPPAVDITINLRIGGAGGASELRLEVAVTGRFQAAHENPNMPLETFARANGPALVMPFVRELVANITARSRNGIVLVPPVNIAALVAAEESHAATTERRD